MVHQMVTDALKFDSWNGDWMELEDWYLTWKLYCEAGCPGINPQAKTVLFISKMPKNHAEFLRNKHLNEAWNDSEMINYLLKEREKRVPLHRRQQAWRQLVPKGNTYQDLFNWYQKWHRRIRDVNVSDMQVLDQFDLSFKPYFVAGLTEVLKT